MALGTDAGAKKQKNPELLCMREDGWVRDMGAKNNGRRGHLRTRHSCKCL